MKDLKLILIKQYLTKPNFLNLEKNINDEKKDYEENFIIKILTKRSYEKNIKVKKDGKVRNGFEVLKFLNPSINDFKTFF